MLQIEKGNQASRVQTAGDAATRRLVKMKMKSMGDFSRGISHPQKLRTSFIGWRVSKPRRACNCYSYFSIFLLFYLIYYLLIFVFHFLLLKIIKKKKNKFTTLSLQLIFFIPLAKAKETGFPLMSTTFRQHRYPWEILTRQKFIAVVPQVRDETRFLGVANR